MNITDKHNQGTPYMNAFLNERDINSLSRRQYEFVIRKYLVWARDDQAIPFDQLQTADVLRYKRMFEDSGCTNLTVVNYMIILRLFYKWMEANRYGKDLTRGIRIIKRYKSFRKKSLEHYQVTKLLKAIDTKTLVGKRDYAIANLMLRNGLREIEIERLNIEDIIDHKGHKAIRLQRKGHTEKDSIMPIPDKALEAIHNYLEARTHLQDDQPMFVAFSNNGYLTRLKAQNISYIIRKYLNAAGINDRMITAHSLRHTAAFFLIDKGAHLHDVMQFMGHTSTETTRIYIKQREQDMIFNKGIANLMNY